MTMRSRRDLHRELQECQRRLGTAAELEDDFARVLSLAHEINNEITAEMLRTADPVDDTSPSMIRLFRAWLNG